MRPRVHMFARKALLQNARIFKQAASLDAAGYAVTVIGVLGPGGRATEEIGGVKILRLPADPPYLPSFERVRGAGPGDGGSRILSPRARTILYRLGFPFRWVEYYRRAYAVVTRELGAPDVIHCNDLDTLPIGLPLAGLYDVPVVYDVQDLYAEQDHIPPWYGRLLKVQERLLIPRVHRITAVNDAIADVLARSYGVDVDAIVLNCPPLYDGEAKADAAPTVREAIGLSADRTLLIYSGGLARHRGLENVVRSLVHLGDDVSLVLLGEGPVRNQLEGIAIESGVRSRVFFHPFVPHASVPAFISSADIGIVPYEHVGLNHYLCSPSKLFHYIMAELTVVCSDFPFLREVVLGNGIGATFDPSSPASIAASIRRAIELRATDQGLADRLASIKRRYCWEQEEQSFLDVYRSLARTDNPAFP